jgi:ATP-binding cassette subfamily F protein 3
LYKGGYTAFERTRAERLAQQQQAYEKQQAQRAHMEKYIARFKAQATKARQAQSRIKALERMERIAPAHVDSPFSFSFRESAAGPDPVLALEDCGAGYGDHVVLDGIKMSIREGARIGLLGRNGAGKSTLIQVINGGIAPLAGTRTEGRGLSIGYFAQHQLETLDPQSSPLMHMLRLDPRVRGTAAAH